MTILLLILGFLFPMNSENNQALSLEDNIVGVWEMQYTEQNKMTYKKVKKLASDQGGIEFLADGTVKLKRNAGWCGTPPISYAEFTGTWKVEGKSLIYTYNYHKQDLKNELKFIEGNERELTFELVYRTQVTF